MTVDGAQETCIVVVNVGSASVRLAVFDQHLRVLEEGHSEREGPTGAGAVLRRLAAAMPARPVAAVGHRIVHGGSAFRQHVLIDDEVLRALARLTDLAPLHNPPALDALAAAQQLWPQAPQAAVFDTAFHASLRPEAFLYPVPRSWFEAWGIRRFGFHGLSHAYCSARTAALAGLAPAAARIVTCHLGAGCSLCAVRGGRSAATTMGFSPLEGLMMATRSGSVDPGALLHLLRTGRIDLAAMDRQLQQESGLLAVAGSADMRRVLAARAAGEPRAALAFDMYVGSVRRGIAAMAAELGGIDALCFTGGVGEGSPEVRAAVLQGLGWMGLAADEAANARGAPDSRISPPGAAVSAWVVATREEWVAAREVRRLMTSGAGGQA